MKTINEDCYRGEVSFWRFRGDGEALREGECLRRLPTSPFFTWDLLGRSSSEVEEEPESVITEQRTTTKYHTLTHILPPPLSYARAHMHTRTLYPLYALAPYTGMLKVLGSTPSTGKNVT